ncbi:MAG: efflux RND transporter periplasmic adaptor subunit [bacterium]|nr:efflux RND transporter periplasmic adaptor subunit [bacterium]
MKKFLIFVVIAVILSAIVFVNVRKRSESAIKVKVESVTHQDLTELVSASGRVQPKVSVDISADISGKITEVAVEEGDVVEEGDLLLLIDPTQYRESVRSAEAQYQSTLASKSEAEARLEQQRLEWQRSRGLYEARDLSDREYESARTALTLAEAQLVSAERNVDQSSAYLEQQRDQLDKTEIRAPMSGVVIQRNADVGEIAIQSSLNIQVLLVIADLSVMEVVVDVDETEIPRIAIDQKTEVEIDAFPDSTFFGRVTEIANSPQQSSGSSGVDFRVVVTLNESYHHLRPGLSATAEITTAERENAVALLIQALTMRNSKTLLADETKNGARLTAQGIEVPPFSFEEDDMDIEGVLIYRDGRAIFTAVQTGIAGEEHFEVISGLEGDEQVIVSPMREIRTLHHGQKVQLAKSDEDKSGEEDDD